MTKKKKKNKKKTSEKSLAQKAAEILRKRKAEELGKIAGTFHGVTAKPDIEKSDVKITPYPSTGDNKEFEKILDGVGVEKEPASKPPAAKPKPPDGPAAGDEMLTVEDVAEWVAWPFMFWALMNKLPDLGLSSKDARSVAEPLTSILNRHGVTKVISPDIVDGMKATARLTPIMGDRVYAIKKERARRAAAGGRSPSSPAPRQPTIEYPQGGQATKPKEV